MKKPLGVRRGLFYACFGKNSIYNRAEMRYTVRTKFQSEVVYPMGRRILPFLLIFALLLSGCGERGPEENPRLTVVAAAYPVYLFACAVTEGVEGVSVERLDTGETSCLHDYTLSVNDMKKLERADIIALNGAGLEDFLDDALTASDAAVIDCSQGVELLPALEHDHEEGDEDHDHGHWDPHIWMDPANAKIMVRNLRDALSERDPDHAGDYESNAASACALLGAWDSTARDLVDQSGHTKSVGLITFHDGFQYFARAYGLDLLEAIEEEAGSEASAHEIVEITELVKERDIPVIFTEVNGSDATARAISRETGCAVAQLSMIMDGPDGALSNYEEALMGNVKAIINGFAGKELVQ